MAVKVRLFGEFRELAGEKEILVKADRLAGVLEELVRRYKQLEGALLEGGKLKKYVSIFVNNRPSWELQEMETPLKDGDTVAIFSPVAGG